MHDLARSFPYGNLSVFKRLARMAIELCGADSGGVSILEDTGDGKQIFRWIALAGELEAYAGGSTPRDWSPCGECLNAGKPMLYSYPARFFTYFQQVQTPIVEGLVVPMQAGGMPIGTIWIVSSHERRGFDAGDVRVMTSLGSFVSAAVKLTAHSRIHADETAAERELVWGELIRRIAGRDSAALEFLMDEARPFVFAKALRILSSPADAEEATSDVFLQVWKIAPRYSAERHGVLPWLLNLARSRAIDRMRTRTRQGQSLDTALSLESSHYRDLEIGVARRQIGDHLRQAMELLSFEQRRAIELAYFGSRTMAEIASQLGHPEGTVKSRIRSGLMALRLLMATQETSFRVARSL